ncbi:hypothetical protein IJG26_02750 [Candidatus Saccharibacteria bacterium]|nr:hypothetical protein [Candidatus Saccharibacteria bacterium]
MEGQDYLNQISAKARPIKKEKGGILSSKFFLVGAIGLIALILIIILGAIIGATKTDVKKLSSALELHINATTDVIKTYQPNLKSSQLRSDSASLNSVLSDTHKRLTDYMTEKYEYKSNKADKKLIEEADTQKDALGNELFEAKINGHLDKVFAQKMAYEITVIMSEEERIYRAAGNETLQGILETSYDSLKILYDKFNEFSEAK